MESGRPGADSGVGGDPCVPNEKSPKLGPCPPAGGLPVRPLAIRHGVRAGQLPFDTPRSQGAPSTIRCIKTLAPARTTALLPRQGAPSTIRCIKTGYELVADLDLSVREHPAPSGALRQPDRADIPGVDQPRQGAPSTIRCIKTGEYPRSPCFLFPVREHPPPPGAFRPEHADVGVELASSQGATNTIRCIKTGAGKEGFEKVREHPAPSGALRRSSSAATRLLYTLSGSTQHHQVH